MHDAPILAILNPDVCERVAELHSAFVSAQPFPHIVIDNFLDDDYSHALLAAFPAFERGNAVGDNGEPGGKSTVDRIKTLGPAYKQLDEVIRSREFLAWLSVLTGIDNLLCDPWYLGGGTHENRNGMSLAAHVDFNFHPSERWHRRLNLIVYLNPLRDQAWGGSLEFFRDPHADSKPSRSVTPLFNRCVVFETSERSWYAFNSIHVPESQQQLTRRSMPRIFTPRIDRNTKWQRGTPRFMSIASCPVRSSKERCSQAKMSWKFISSLKPVMRTSVRSTPKIPSCVQRKTKAWPGICSIWRSAPMCASGVSPIK